MIEQGKPNKITLAPLIRAVTAASNYTKQQAQPLQDQQEQRGCPLLKSPYNKQMRLIQQSFKVRPTGASQLSPAMLTAPLEAQQKVHSEQHLLLQNWSPADDSSNMRYKAVHWSSSSLAEDG